MNVTRAFTIATALSVLACESSPSTRSTNDATSGNTTSDSGSDGVEATVGITDSTTATESVVTIHTALQALAASATVDTKADTVNLTIACDSGKATSTLTVASTGPGTAVSAHRFQFHACKFGDETLSGQLDWTVETIQSPTAGLSRVVFDGSLAYEGPTFAGNYSFNALTIECATSSAGATCSITGTYSVGGVRYSIDETMAIRFFE